MLPAMQRRTARKNGLVNVGPMYRAAERVGLPFYVACALFQKESGGRNIYGHDKGGALSTNGRSVTVEGKTWPPNSDIPVTPANAGIFLMIIGTGALSNGMGPAQITYARDLPDGRTGGYFRQMLERGLLPWYAEDNMFFGLEILKRHYDASRSWVKAGTAYNGRVSYGEDLARLIKVWKERLS
jgi:hypothetical protein